MRIRNPAFRGLEIAYRGYKNAYRGHECAGPGHENGCSGRASASPDNESAVEVVRSALKGRKTVKVIMKAVSVGEFC